MISKAKKALMPIMHYARTFVSQIFITPRRLLQCLYIQHEVFHNGFIVSLDTFHSFILLNNKQLF